jgi:hypothetical protein
MQKSKGKGRLKRLPADHLLTFAFCVLPFDFLLVGKNACAVRRSTRIEIPAVPAGLTDTPRALDGRFIRPV